jgi:hypothetical protein
VLHEAHVVKRIRIVSSSEETLRARDVWVSVMYTNLEVQTTHFCRVYGSIVSGHCKEFI